MKDGGGNRCLASTVILDSGGSLTLYHDLLKGLWYVQRA